MSEDQVKAKQAELDARQKEADDANKSRKGVGTRVRVGQTRGKNPMVISWEAFDESLPDTLPTTPEQFIEVTGVKDAKTLLGFWIAGYNDEQYTQASDPLKEYVNPAWPADAQAQFRVVVRNYARGTNTSLEEAVGLIKPGFEKQFAASKEVAA